MKSNTIDDIKRIVFEDSIPIPSTGCWLTEGCTDKDGYPYIKYRGKTHKLHRLVVELIKGESLEGKQALHYCDVPSCINPNHLYAGTPVDNNRDTVVRDRRNNRKSKVDLEEVKRILLLNYTQREVARHLGISESWLSTLVKRIAS